MRDILNDIWSNLRTNKLRTALTGFAVTWGIFMLIVLLGAGNGLINAIQSNSGDYLPNTMRIWSGWTSKPYDGLPTGRSMSMDEKDIESLSAEDMADIIEEVGGLSYKFGANIRHGKEFIRSTLAGVDNGFVRRNKVRLMCGRFINQADEKERRKVVAVTYRNARILLGAPEKKGETKSVSEKAKEVRHLLGKYLKVDGALYKVVGIVASEENSFNEDSYIPASTLRAIYSKGPELDNIELEFKELKTSGAEMNEELKKLNGRVLRKLNANHRAAPDDDSAFWMWNRLSSKIMMDTSLNMIRTALWIVGILTLISGIVGVSNIMLISVKERTHEFGIRKAIGAKPRSILGLILTESVMITGFFGYIGMFLGVLACEAMNQVSGKMVMDIGIGQATVFKDPTVSLGVCVGATVLLIAAGTLAGLTPARKAAKVRPIEALREE